MAIDSGSEPRLVLYLKMLINPFIVPKFCFVGFRPPPNFTSPTSTITLVIFPPFLRQERSTRPQTFSVTTKDLHTRALLNSHYSPPPPLLFTNTTTAHNLLTPPSPIIMSIRRNVRVSFLLNDSESSFELYVSNRLLGPISNAD